MNHDKALAVLATVSGLDPSEIGPDRHLVADLGIDSPKALRLLVELEEEFDIEIPDEDAAMMSTVADILAYIDQHA